MKISWEHAELYLTHHGLFYFGYRSWFSRYRTYHRSLAFYRAAEELPGLLPTPKTFVVDFSDYAKGVWEIRFRRPQASVWGATDTMRLSDLPLDAADAIQHFGWLQESVGNERPRLPNNTGQRPPRSVSTLRSPRPPAP
jgi:hypothetical protein